MLFFLISLFSLLFSILQLGPDPGGGPGDIPIVESILLLVGAGLFYGIKSIINNKKKNGEY